MEKVRITLVKSTISSLKNQKATIEALGLKKIGQSKEFTVSDSLNGMIAKVNHLVKVEKI
ncbi:MAG TPA: 50S ribosomal protein L30 [Clostridiales bacterium]|nr:50S ribosomal protein L30 [Clostridiales bacterium]HBJ97506.1 50S ribosomal protein L30 [Clostridiales bacterium]